MEKPTTKVFGVCDFCGYDAEAAVKYQMKQNGEELSEEEYEEEVAFYLFVSHADFCSEMADMVGEYDKDGENKTEHDQAKIVMESMDLN
tara:strand:- start:187 stop:453 length:267 start_codon:yes stop_codon:yes gene_type:complete